MVLPDTHPESLLTRLPKATREIVCPNGEVAIRVPGHTTILDTLKMLPGPIVMTSANRVNQPKNMTAEEAVKVFGDEIQLVLDDGRSRFGQPATVVRVKDKLEILRQGVASEQTLRRLSAMMILLVCTGNTCRSPMAEGICRKMLAEKIGCTVDELHDRGVLVMSAGITATMGGTAANEAVAALQEHGIDLTTHESQPVTEKLIRHADVIWTMTRSHRQAIVNSWPDAAARTTLLSMDERDIADPIGGPLEYYRKCAEQITNELSSRLDDLKI
jgi:protein-tyrosine phosphatase